MLNEFIAYLLSMVGCSLYVWGAQGESIKGIVREWAEKKETSGNNVSRIMKLLDKLLKDDFYFYDCSGLGVSWLLKNKLIKSDMTAHQMYNLCTKITKSQLKKGDWVFVLDSSGTATHIGYLVDNNLNVVESRGRNYGVVQRKLSEGQWNAYGRADKLFPELSESEKDKSRVLMLTNPRMRGEDVKLLQREIGAEPDGIFGPDTDKLLKAKQKELGLTVDGKAGKDTFTSLGLTWIE